MSEQHDDRIGQWFMAEFNGEAVPARLDSAVWDEADLRWHYQFTTVYGAIDQAVEAAHRFTLEEVDAARDRVVSTENQGWAPHMFVYALLAELGIEVTP